TVVNDVGSVSRKPFIALSRMVPSMTRYFPVGNDATLRGSTSPICSIDDLSRSSNCLALPDRFRSSLTMRVSGLISTNFIARPMQGFDPCRKPEASGALPDGFDLLITRVKGDQRCRKPMPARAIFVADIRGLDLLDRASPRR